MTASLTELLLANPEIERVEAFLLDVNGIARGKWLPRAKALELDSKGLPMPRSAHALDIWGCDVEAAGLAFGTGDPDGICRPVHGSAALMPWAARPTAQVLLQMEGANGGPFHGDPRAVLQAVAGRFADRGLATVVATELEFYLFDPAKREPTRPPNSGSTRWACARDQVLSVDALRQHEALFDEIAESCALQQVPAETILRENGAGQYEINLTHVADACLAADHAILLKRIVKGTARKHGLLASFMAKPDGARAGSGMHIHCSLRGQDSTPLFAGQPGIASKLLMGAVAGLVVRLPEMMLLLAPHANSYRRFRPHSHAPTCADWGIDNRSAAVRLILGEPSATRLEQRVAGADSNPHLAVAATLAAMLDGIDAGNDATEDLARPLPTEWGAAISAFEASDFIASSLGAQFQQLFAACKRQDFDKMLSRVTDVELDTGLELL